MLVKAGTLKGYKLESLDGEIGKAKEFFFDDLHWTIRYLVADTGTWLTGRQVLISPYALSDVNNDEQYIAVDLTRKQINDSPSVDSDKPVSRQFEEAYYKYHGWPQYWGGPFSWGAYPYVVRDPEKWREAHQGDAAADPNLHSTDAVSGHHVQCLDGDIGHVDDFIIDDQTWAIRYLVIDTHNWLPGKKVLVSPQWTESVGWAERKVFVNLSRDAIKRSPEYTGEGLLTREYEIGLHQHYDRTGYWVDELIPHGHTR
jgi:hypothetical protein